MNNPATKNKRMTVGTVVQDKADKTVRVRIERRVRHPLYKKIMRRHSDVQAHDPENRCRIGDRVVLQEMPRYSKTKSWLVAETKKRDTREEVK